MKLLALLQARKAEDQIGYHDGFERLLRDGMLTSYDALPYRTLETPQAWRDFYKQIITKVKDKGIDILLLQYFHGHDILSPISFVKQLRKINPEIIIITTCGDPFGRVFLKMPRSLLDAASVSDISFFTGMGYMAQTAVKAGAKNVMLMPNGCCQVRFGDLSSLSSNESKEFDLLFIGSNNAGRNPFTFLSNAGRQRKLMVKRLERRYGNKFGLFGRNWNGQKSWMGSIFFEAQNSCGQRSRLVIGGFPAVKVPYYTSDRVFTSLASGVPFLDFRVPRVDRFFKDGKDWYLYNDMDTMITLIDNLLEMDSSILHNRAIQCRDTLFARHTQYHRCKDMLEIVDRLRRFRRKGRALPPQLSECFHNGVKPEDELPFAVFNWQG